eukprot:8122202-Alexandrium_andersonii.AAC.1
MQALPCAWAGCRCRSLSGLQPTIFVHSAYLAPAVGVVGVVVASAVVAGRGAAYPSRVLAAARVSST